MTSNGPTGEGEASAAVRPDPGRRVPALVKVTRPAASTNGPGFPWRVRLLSVMAAAVLFMERVASALTPAFAVSLFVLALAWTGLPRQLPALGHGALLLLAVVALAVALWRGWRRFRLPARAEVLRRLETDSGLVHRPLTHLDDRQASNLIDPAAALLWARHRAWLQASIGRLELGAPDTGATRSDPLALRQLALLLAVAAFFFAGEAWQRRLEQALVPNFSGIDEGSVVSVEAWITPPDYTLLPPTSLSNASKETAKTLDIPAGSRLLIQAQGLPTSGLGGPAGLVANGATTSFAPLDETTQRVEVMLSSGSSIAVRSGMSTVVEWPVNIRPDQAPGAAFAAEPAATDRGVLRLAYLATDDYGVADLRLVVSRGVESFEFKLPLGQATTGEDGRKLARGGSFQDLTGHSWAGLDVELRLVARDALGQIGASAPLAMTLPERKFYHPVARAIIEQRKLLAGDWRTHIAAARELMVLKAQPDAYDDNIVAFMGMDFAARRLAAAPFAPSDLAPILQLMWDTALDIEDGGTSIALREFRRLQQELADALQRGAPDEEIERLMNQLQEAMNRYMQELQQQMQRAMESGMPLRQLSPNGIRLSQRDLNQMLNDARRMAQSGARDSAQQMLNQLQKLMESLQAGVPQTMSEEGRAAQQMANELGRMMQRQQKLLEESYNAQRGQQPGENGMGEGEMSSGEGLPGDGGGGGAGSGAGAAGQEQLRRDLGGLMRDLGNMLEDIPGGLGDAEQAMRRAVEALSREDFAAAAQAQNEALSQLQQGLQQTQQMMERRSGPLTGRGQRDQMDPFGRAPADGDSQGNNNAVENSGVEVPDQGEMERAREIFEELRLRRNDPTRPKPEREYLDRLLKQF